MNAHANLRPRRQLFWLLLAVAGAIAAWGFWPRALMVETAPIARGPLTVIFNEEARTRLHDRWLVSAPLAGVVERIALRPGDTVTAGQTVAVLVPSRASLFDPARRAEALARANAAVQAETAAVAAIAAADAERTRSRAELRRAEALAADRLIARADLDAVRASAASADAALRSARAQREAARIERDAAREVLALQGASGGGDVRIALPAPVAGSVVRRLVESATPVQAGQPLLEIGDPQAIEVISEVLTADAVRVSRGTPVLLTRWGGDAPLRGHVHVVEPGGFTKISALGVEEQRVLVVVTLDEPASARRRLGDGFRLEAEFIVWQSPDALSVPTAALFRDGARWAVYAVEKGRARLRHVELGRMGEDAAQVKDGLREGERVVLYPGDTVRDGRRVRSE
jgi:HlyD family secretion protein